MAEEKKQAPKQPKDAAKKTKDKPANTAAFLEYKGKPLVRKGNTVYYGDMNDPYVVCLNIKNDTEYKDITLAQDVTIQLISTDESLSLKERMIKSSEKKGFFTALDLGATWLERQLKKG